VVAGIAYRTWVSARSCPDNSIGLILCEGMKRRKGGSKLQNAWDVLEYLRLEEGVGA